MNPTPPPPNPSGSGGPEGHFGTLISGILTFAEAFLEEYIEENGLRDDVEVYEAPAPIPRQRHYRRHIERCREAGNERLIADYFSDNPTYTPEQFLRRFRMRRPLFERIMTTVVAYDGYFQMRQDATGRCSLSPHKKCTAAMRMLAYGVSADSIDEYLRIGEKTSLDCLRHFVQAVRVFVGEQYLRSPTPEDLSHLLEWGERRGFPGMLGSTDCMHWEWRNCPTAWKGCNNDINVLNQSPLLHELYNGKAPQVCFTANSRSYNNGYYLEDGIYPDWPIFVKTIPIPQGRKEKLFTMHQEGARKDVERAFGILLARFAIVRGPGRAWDIQTLMDIMYSCVILHNMVVEDERHTYAIDYTAFGEYDHLEPPLDMGDVQRRVDHTLQSYLTRMMTSRDKQLCYQLKNDLVDHIWNKFGDN